MASMQRRTRWFVVLCKRSSIKCGLWTKTLDNTVTPVWNHNGELDGYQDDAALARPTPKE
eukprot:100144-Amphidinium_carterae.1